MIADKLGELLDHLMTKLLQAFHRLQGLAHVHSHGDLQNARRTRVDGQNFAIVVQQDDAGCQVVKHGLQMATRQIHLCHAALYRISSIRELLGHVGK